MNQSLAGDLEHHHCRQHKLGVFGSDLIGGGVSRSSGRLQLKIVPFQVTIHGSALAFQVTKKSGNAVVDRRKHCPPQTQRNREAVVDKDRSDPAPGSGYRFDTVLQPKVTEILSFKRPFGKSNLPKNRKNQYRQRCSDAGRLGQKLNLVHRHPGFFQYFVSFVVMDLKNHETHEPHERRN